jgi:hypothetical protein
LEVSRVQTLILLLIAIDLTECHAYGRQPQDHVRKITVSVAQSKSATIKRPNTDGVLRRGQTGTLLMNRVLKDAVVVPQRATFEVHA